VKDSHEVAAQRDMTAAHDQGGKSRIGTCPSDLPVKNTTYDTKVWHDFPKGRFINATAPHGIFDIL
jgi:hypothetical protein